MVRAGVKAYPSSYDLRALGLVSTIRNQNPFGTCWAFAPYASLESNIKKTTGMSIDFSEWHTAWFAYNPLNGLPAFTKRTLESGQDAVFDQGGHSTMFTAVATRGTGPALEAEAPYQNTRNYLQTSLPKGTEPNAAIVKGVYGFDECDKDTIKGLVQTHGALSTSMMWPEENESSYYNSATRAFRYVQNGDFDLNHGVSIVGWDDSFSKDKFPASNQPDVNGAWIVRNSWGPTWGEGGYFYMSYDTSLKYFDSFIGALQFNAKVYQYDPLGLVSALGYGESTAWFSNMFTAAGDTVTDVAFYTAAANAGYEISVRTGVGANPGTGALAFGPQSGTLELPGYHRVRLSSPVSVAGGQKFAVIVKLTTPGYNWPVPVQYPYKNYSDGATALPDVGFISYSGAVWSDVKSAVPERDNVSVCLKAFASPGWAPPDGSTSADPQLLGFGSAYGGSDPRYDLNGDGSVDNADLLELFRWMGW
jgi:C1A family cysteine protease